MTHAHLVSHSWTAGPLILAGVLAVAGLVPKSAEAQPTIQEVDKAVSELKGTVSQLQKDVQQLSMAASARQPAPPEAWEALRWVGVAFVIAWAVVSWRRERSSEEQARSQYQTKDARITELEGMRKQLEERIDGFSRLVLEAERTGRRPLPFSDLLKWLAPPKR